MCCYTFDAERHHYMIRSLHTESCSNNKHGCPSTNPEYSKKLSIVKLQNIQQTCLIFYICFDLEFSYDPPRGVGQPNQ